VPRRQYTHAYRDDAGDLSLATCGVYFIALVILGGIVMFLLLHVFWGSV
jgi:hypothetical protein